MAKRNKARKEKKINPYAPVLLVIVIAIATMGIIPILLDKTYEESYAEIQQSLSDSYKTVEKLVKDVTKEANKLADTIKKLNGVHMDTPGWVGASDDIVGKLEEVEKFHENFINSFTDEVLGLTYIEHFNYVHEGKIAYEWFAYLKANAEVAITRATSEKQLNDAFAQYKKDVEGIPTIIEALQSKISGIEKNNITLSDLDAFADARNHLSIIDLRVFAEGQYDAFNTKINTTIYNSLKAVARQDFIDKAKKLPSNYQLIYQTKPVHDAEDAYALLLDPTYGLYTQEELLAIKGDFALCRLYMVDASRHADVIDQMIGDKETEGTAAYINAKIDSYKGALNTKNPKPEIKADAETNAWITELELMIEAWDRSVWTSKDGEYVFKVIFAKFSTSYSEDIINLVNRETVAQYRAKYNEAVRIANEEALKNNK